MSENADDALVGRVAGFFDSVFSVTSTRCRMFQRHVSAVFAASFLRNVFAEVEEIPLERPPVGVPDPFVHAPLAIESESSLDPLRDFA